MSALAYFLDTNILIYATSFAADHAAKKPIAREWVARSDWGTSSQVLMEFYANAKQPRHGMGADIAREFIDTIIAYRQIQAITPSVVHQALDLLQRYSLSHWDAAVLMAAKALGAPIVISEDMGHGQSYDGITVINPFLPVHNA